MPPIEIEVFGVADVLWAHELGAHRDAILRVFPERAAEARGCPSALADWRSLNGGASIISVVAPTTFWVKFTDGIGDGTKHDYLSFQRITVPTALYHLWIWREARATARVWVPFPDFQRAILPGNHCDYCVV